MQDGKRHSQPSLDAKGIFKQEIIKFWPNNVFNTQFTSKTVDLNLDLTAKRTFSGQNNVIPSLGQKMSFST